MPMYILNLNLYEYQITSKPLYAFTVPSGDSFGVDVSDLGRLLAFFLIAIGDA